MTLANKLNRIIGESGITKREFAHRLRISENYVYVLTGGRKDKRFNQRISPILAKVIALEFNCAEDWLTADDEG